MADETPEVSADSDLDIRRRRLSIRCWRRGIREMDLILGGYLDRHGAALDAGGLDALERLIEVDDQTLYRWVSGAEPAPAEHAATVARVVAARI